MTREWSTGVSKGYVFEFYNHHHEHGLPRSQADVLINNSGHAYLADFTFSLPTIASDQSTDLSPGVEDGTIQWMSPELLDPERFGFKKGRPTEESDCYALGMVIYEVLSGQIPYDGYNTLSIIWRALEGKHPERPQGGGGGLFTDAIWSLLELCWKPQPTDRPSAKTILRSLEGAPPLLPSSGVCGGGETDTDSSDVIVRGSSALSPFCPRLTPNSQLLPLTIDAAVDDNKSAYGLGLSLTKTDADQSDTDDGHYFNVIPLVRVAPSLCCTTLWFTSILQ